MNPAGNLQRLSPGKIPKRVSSRTWNTFVEIAEDRARDLNGSTIPAGDLSELNGQVLVANATGAARLRGEILTLGEPLIDPSSDADEFFHRPAFHGQVPDATAANRRKFCVLIDGLGIDEVGQAMLVGFAVCKIDVLSTAHTFARVIHGDCTKLESSYWGRAQILWQQDGIGTKWAYVQLGLWTYPHVVAQTVGPHLMGDTKTYTPHVGTTITGVVNRYGDIPDGKWVRIGFDNDQPEVVTRQC